jgi:hypothetical protein
MAWSARSAWLSLTPEPERELPVAVAELRAGRPPSAGEVEAERRCVERLVVRGSRRAWVRYLREAIALAERAEPSEARAVALDVVRNHHALAVALPGSDALAADRERLRRIA